VASRAPGPQSARAAAQVQELALQPARAAEAAASELQRAQAVARVQELARQPARAAEAAA
jgi:hypothetical protein